MRDIEVTSRNGRTQVVVEVKRLPRKDREWASAVYQLQVLADADGSEVPYFMLLLPDRLFVWKASPGSAPRPPDLELDTAEVLGGYLPQPAGATPLLDPEALVLAAGAWLDDLARADPVLVQAAWAEQLAGLGLLDAIRGGRVRYGVLA